MIVNIKHLYSDAADETIARLAARNAARRAYRDTTGEYVCLERSIDETVPRSWRPQPRIAAHRKCRRRPWWFGGLAAMYLAGYATALYFVPWGLAAVIGLSLAYLMWAARVAPTIERKGW